MLRENKYPHIVLSMVSSLLALMAWPAFAASTVTLAESGQFILPSVQAPEIFKQCSRKVPGKIDDYWEPGPADIGKLESRLLPFLASVGAANAPPPGAYNRQYVGFKHNGRAYIYGNFYPALPQAELKKQNTIPVLVCDGGREFWGIVYRVDTGKFQALTFNGSS